MTLPRGLQLPIFFHTDDTANQESAGIDVPYEEYDVKPGIFYDIACLTKVEEDGKVYTKIHSNGTTFISPLKVEAVQAKIDKLLASFTRPI